MSTPYWRQWSHGELMSMQGIEIDEPDYDDYDEDYDREECEREESCPRCTGGGCNYCLMLEW